jgi:hypothetical protein
MGFDSLIEGQGVMIWHCNEDAAYDNGNDNFRIVDLEEADGFDHLENKINLMDSGDPYPGSSNNTSFTDNTYPSAIDHFGNFTGVSAEGFAYTTGPGSDVIVTLTQRSLEGYTLGYQTFAYSHTNWSETPITEWGAIRFNTIMDGDLAAIQTVVKPSGHSDYAIRIFDDMNGGEPSGLHSTTPGIFPSVSSSRYLEIPLVDSLPLSQDQPFLIDIQYGPSNRGVPWGSTTRPASGESYFSEDGTSYANWTNRDILIRARIRYGFKCGDANGDDQVNVGDAVFLISYIFKGGPGPDPLCAGDANGDGDVNVGDAVFLINYVFKGGMPPAEPCCP